MNSQPHLQPASETSGLKTPHGRVVAKIVCAVWPCDTLVQYAAYRVPSSLLGGEGWYHSIPIILVGMALHLFFSGQ